MTLPRIFHLVVVSVLALPVSGNIQAPETDLNLLLKQCSAYWEGLLETSFGIHCREEIRERIYHSHPDKGGIVNLSELGSPKGSEVRAFVYDLRFVYQDGAREESRTLLLEDGRKTRVENARMAAGYFEIEYMIFEPIHYLSSANHRYFEYQPAGRVTLNKKEVEIIQFNSNSQMESESISGKIWVELGDFRVMRMEIETTIPGAMEGMTKSGNLFEVDSKRFMRVEYLYEEDGIRPPSSVYVKETLFAPSMKTSFPRAELSIYYKDYRMIAWNVL